MGTPSPLSWRTVGTVSSPTPKVLSTGASQLGPSSLFDHSGPPRVYRYEGDRGGQGPPDSASKHYILSLVLLLRTKVFGCGGNAKGDDEVESGL